MTAASSVNIVLSIHFGAFAFAACALNALFSAFLSDCHKMDATREDCAAAAASSGGGSGAQQDAKPASLEQQAARTLLRQRFLRCLLSQRGTPVQLDLRDHTDVWAKSFAAADLDCEAVILESLITPMGELTHAKVRFSDVIAVHFEPPPEHAATVP